MAFNSLKSCFTVFILIVAAYASLATSDGTFSLANGSLLISSDCVSPARVDNSITVDNYEITDPAATDYTDFGFPDTSVGESSAQKEVGTVGGKTRVCEITYQLDEDIWVYTCVDNGEYACTITIENL